MYKLKYLNQNNVVFLFVFLFRLTPRIFDAFPLSRERGERRPQCGRWGEYNGKYDNKLFLLLHTAKRINNSKRNLFYLGTN